MTTENKYFRSTWANINKVLVLFIITIVVFNVVFAVWNGLVEILVVGSFKIGITFLIVFVLSWSFYCWKYDAF